MMLNKTKPVFFAVFILIFSSRLLLSKEEQEPKIKKDSGVKEVSISTTSTQLEVSTSVPKPDLRTNIEKLNDPDPVVRRNAVIRLGAEKNKKNVSHLIRMIDDENQMVRRGAINALSNTGDKRAASPLIMKYKTEEKLNVKMNIIMALGDLKSRESLPLLKKLLKDGYPITRTEAIRAIGKIDSPETDKDIVNMLNDEAEGVRIMAAEVLSERKVLSAGPLLRKNLKDPIAAVRSACAKALGDIGDKASIEDLNALLADKDPSVVEAAKESLKKLK